GEGPRLGRGVVAVPDVHLGAVGGAGAEVIQALAVVALDRAGDGRVDRPAELQRVLLARHVVSGDLRGVPPHFGGGAGDGAGGGVDAQAGRQPAGAPVERVARA